MRWEASLNMTFGPGRVSCPARAIISIVVGLAAVISTSIGGSAVAQDVAEVRIAFLNQIVELPPKLSNLDIPPEDDGFAGGRLAIKDSNTTGQFMKQSFSLHEVDVPADGDAMAAFSETVAAGYQFIVLNVPADALLAMADQVAGQEVLLFNAGAPDDRLRRADCRANVLHTLPSRAMKADALAQYLAWKRWRDWFLVIGQRPGDKLFADAIRRSAKLFGGKIVAERTWDFGADARRTAQAEVPKFTQDVDYDVLIVADEIGVFGEYLAYRTWSPRPVMGTQGLAPTTWHRTHEQWGAAQLQSRFLKTYERRMRPLDYQVWAAIRSVSEAATRTRSTEFGPLRDYVRGPEFELAGFKGQKLTFRTWNGQLRQPILLAAPAALVSVSPQEGFLHQRSLLDTLGYEEPVAGCTLN